MSRLQLALDLRARGFSVIPLYPKSKQAMVKWTEFQRRIASEEEISEWFAREPDANVGIVTGGVSNVVVGDVDPRHGGSVADMQRDAPSGFVVTTPGGGAHFYYKHPGGPCPKSKPRPGIDFQADGCYVVAAGSYVVTDAYEGEYHQLSSEDFGTAPAWLLARPAEGAGREESGGGGSGEAWVGAAFRDGCQPGTRNDTLARLTGYLAGKRIPEDVAAPILTKWVLSQEGTGVTPEEAARTIGSIYDKERRARRKTPGDYVVDEFSEEAKSGPMASMKLADFGARYFNESVEWLVPEWLPARTVAFLVSPPAHFKTMLTFDLAISVAGGWPFLGQFPVQQPGPVLVIQQEDDYGDMARRFSRIFAARQPGRAVAQYDDETFGDHLAVSDLPPVHIVTERGFTLGVENLRRLEDKIREIHPRIVIIDPLYSITSTEDFMASAAKDMMPLKRLRDVYDCSFVISAHTKKGAAEGREGLWGSQFLNAFLETGWQIRGRADGEWNQIQLLRHFKSSGQLPSVNMEFLLDENEGYQIQLSDPEEDEPQDAVLKALAGSETGLGTKAIADKAGMPERTVRRRLKKFKDKGLVVECPEGYKIPKETYEEPA